MHVMSVRWSTLVLSVLSVVGALTAVGALPADRGRSGSVLAAADTRQVPSRTDDARHTPAPSVGALNRFARARGSDARVHVGGARALTDADTDVANDWIKANDYKTLRDATTGKSGLEGIHKAYYELPYVWAAAKVKAKDTSVAVADTRKAFAAPDCKTSKSGFCVVEMLFDANMQSQSGAGTATAPAVVNRNRLRSITFRAGWDNSESPGGELVKPVMCAALGANAVDKCLGGTGAEPYLASGHVINHKLGSKSLFVDKNPVNFFPQDAFYNVFPSAWTDAEHFMKKVMGLCGNADPQCYASATITLNYGEVFGSGAGPCGAGRQPLHAERRAVSHFRHCSGTEKTDRVDFVGDLR